MGLGGANVQLGRMHPSLNIFTPSPFVSELYANSCNARAEGAACSEVRIKCTSRGECCSPSNPGTPQNCLRRFCGEPHSGFPPPLGKSVVLYHGSIVTPFLHGFPRNRSPLKGDPPFRGTPSALGHEDVRGRRLYDAAMLCRLQCARFAKRMAHCRRTSRQPSALIRSPRRSRGLRPVSAW